MTTPPGHWRVQSSRYVCKDRWIAVRADDCVTDEGVEVAPFYVLEYPDWVQVVALDRAGRVLLVEQYRHAIGRLSVELPAGAMEPDDADPIAAAARELMEETGCAGSQLELIHTSSPNPATHTNQIHTVLARDARPAGEPQENATERITTRWVSAREAFDRAMSGDMPSIQAAPLLAALWRDRRLAFTEGKT